MQIKDLPEVIPVVPLRNDVIFPGIEFPSSIARVRSINSLIQAQQTEHKYVLVLAQKDDTPELADPQIEQLHTVGTLCKLVNVLGGGTGLRYQVLFLGQARFKAETLELVNSENPAESYIQAKGVELEETVPDANETKLVLEELVKILPEYANFQVIDLHLLNSAMQKNMNPVSLSYLLSATFHLTLTEKQNLILESNVVERLKFFIKKMSLEINTKKAQAAIHKRAMENLQRSQKEMFLKEQMRAIQQELGTDQSSIKDDYEKRFKQAKMPSDVLKVAHEELGRLEQLHPSSSEYNVVRNYLEWLINIPWNKSTKDRVDVKQAEDILDEDHFGLQKPKQRILEYLAVAKLKNSLKGPIICLAGPPGVGKTSLGRSIARSLGRKFARIALGGVRDESEIRGHRRTYVGAMPGKLAYTLKRLEVNNPVILLDEIDKMGKGMQGDPASAMLEVLDPEQNHTFSDHYLDVPLDLSNVLFICTANVLEDIPAPLRDRMEIIYVSGYTSQEKFHIAQNHLVPKVLQENGVDEKKIKVLPESLTFIVNHYTRESGVRELQRQISAVMRGAIKELVSNNTQSLTITPEKVLAYLGPKNYHYEQVTEQLPSGVAIGLAWTAVGGDILTIEANKMPGYGKIMLTGSLGEVMKESAQIALSYIRTHAAELKIAEDFNKIDIHIHLPAGAIPKDGPSAGITLLTTMVSLLTNHPLTSHVAMTGELSLKGKVLAVGGIKEKLIAAHRSGIKKVLIPKENEDKLSELPKEVLDGLNIKLVSTVAEVLKEALDIENLSS